MTLGTLLFVQLMGCKKKMSLDDCVARCDAVGKSSFDRCLLENPKDLCEAANADGAASCHRTCELAVGANPSASTSLRSAAAPGRAFAGTEAGARELLAQFVVPGADHAGLSKELRPTTEDYRALYAGAAAAELEASLAGAWDSGGALIAPKPGQTQVNLSSATTEDFAERNDAAQRFPGGYAKVAPHLNAGVVLYQFSFVRPGEEYGMRFDGLSYVNGRWVIVPKPWRALSASEPAAPADDGVKTAPAGKAKGAARAVGGGAVTRGPLTSDTIRRVVRSHDGALRRCYDRGRASNPALQGRINVKFAIGPSGNVATVSDGGSDIGAPAVVACVLSTFSRIKFPAHDQGSVAASYPVVFKASR